MQSNRVLGIVVKRLVFLFKFLCVYVDLNYLCLSNVFLDDIYLGINALGSNSKRSFMSFAQDRRGRTCHLLTP